MAALSEIEKLEARLNENPDGRFFAPLADAYRKAGQPDVAIGLINKHIGKHPEYLSAHIVLGRCFLDKKDDAGAAGAFKRVLELDGENIIALKSMAEITERTGDTHQARKWLMRLLQVDQMNSEAEEDLARLGGPLADTSEQPAAPAEEAPAHVSFADLAAPEEPVPAEPLPEAPTTHDMAHEPLVLDAPMQPSSLGMAEEKTVEMTPPEPAVSLPADTLPMMDLEPTSFEAPTVPVEGIQLEELETPQPTAEDFSRPSMAAPAIDFLGATPAAARPPEERTTDELDPQDRKQTLQRLSESEYEGFGVAPTHDADAVAPPPAPPEVLDAPMTPSTVSTTVEPEPAPEPAAEPAPAPSDLQLIMPEEVTPADELRRPSIKQVRAITPDTEPASAPAAAALVTETMADLYLQQGLKGQAADVYRQLIAARPDDQSLRAKLAALEAKPARSAAALGTEAVGSWLKRIASAVLPGSPAAPPPAPPAGQSPMDAAFENAQKAEDAGDAKDAEDAPAGEPARPASSAFSLDQIFGGAQARPSATVEQPPKHTLGASFDEFFGAAPAESAKPAREEGAKSGGDDDLSAFNAWLHGLKG